MAKCADCAWFPWKPGADVSILPAMRCSSRLTARRWTPAGVTTEHECSEFMLRNSEEVSAEEIPSPVVKEEKEPATLQMEEQASQKLVPEQEQGEVKVDDINSGVEDEAQEAAKRANTSRRKR